MAVAAVMAMVVGTGVGVLTGLFSATPAQAASTVGGPITRSEIIDRAKDWVPKAGGGNGLIDPVQYYQTNPSKPDNPPGRNGNAYRNDCSGYVSMAWHLSGSMNTLTLIQGANPVAYPIDKSSLKAGDILDTNVPTDGTAGDANHVILFDSWINQSAGTFWFYAFGSYPVHHSQGNILGTGSLDGHPANGYGRMKTRSGAQWCPTVLRPATMCYRIPDLV